MIRITKINGENVVINAELIEEIKETPDTVITLTNSRKILVEESTDELINMIIDYHQKISTGIMITGER